MFIPRIYYPQSLSPQKNVTLNASQSYHLLKVLRLNIGDAVLLFNDTDSEFEGTIHFIEKKAVVITVGNPTHSQPESLLKIHLGYALSRHDKFELVIQKATELGVDKITPLITERVSLKIPGPRIEKRLQRWESIIISACEQAGRTCLPKITQPITLENWVKNHPSGTKVIFHPEASSNLQDFTPQHFCSLLIGPESGFSDREIALAETSDFKSASLGPRILRTETAAIVAVAMAQTLWGDL